MKFNKLIKDIEADYFKSNIPLFKIGNFVSIDVLIQEGNKKRIQSYTGKVISQHLAGLNSTITVRKISKGIGVERIFLLHSPDISSLNIIEK